MSDPSNILDEARSITEGVRAKDYGSARENAEVFARMASAATGLDIEPEHLPTLMICLKLARIQGGGSFHRDSWVDIAGYARVAEMVNEDGAPARDEKLTFSQTSVQRIEELARTRAHVGPIGGSPL